MSASFKAVSPYHDPFATLPEDETTGQTCELKKYDVRYNTKGKRVTLEAGTTQDLGLLKRGNGSALHLTTWYTKDSDVEYTELLVKSPRLVAALKEVIQKYPGVSLDGREIVIPDLPKCLFHYRNELISYWNNLGDWTTREHVKLLLDHTSQVLESQMRSHRSLMESPDSAPSLSFENLWMAFKPGSYIYHKRPATGTGLVFKLKRMTRDSESKNWCIEGEQIHYDGKDFGYVTTMHHIRPYDGIWALKQLHLIPLQYLSNLEEIKSEMIKRGKIYVSLRGVHHKKYDSEAEALAPSRNISAYGEEDSFPLRSTRAGSHRDHRLKLWTNID